MNILDDIVASKRKEIDFHISAKPLKELECSRYFERKTFSISQSIIDRNRTGIIAEFKRRSPSKGIINSKSLVGDVTSGYFNEGASAVSILTEEVYFGGSCEDLTGVRETASFPILRKDFTIDEYQVVESKSIGADAILIIAAILEKNEILRLSRLARSLELEVLMEVHEKAELDKANEYVNIIGVNNRDLKTFSVNTDISVSMARFIPSGFIKISESGISSAGEIKKLREAGFQGFLMGERFMASSNPVMAFSEFVKEINL